MLVHIFIDFWFKINYPKTIIDLEFRQMYFLTKNIKHHTELETIWTIIPTIQLMLMAVPSLQLLYSMDTFHDAHVSVKVTGHQWYWSYEVTRIIETNIHEFDVLTEKFDSYMIMEDDLSLSYKRLLSVDNNLALPYAVHTRLLVTSNDVIHSWGVAAFGVKIDAVPGRLNQVDIFPIREGLFYGNCYELCGTNHSAMPIVVIVYDPISD